MNLVKMMTEEKGEHHDEMSSDDYWKMFSDGKSMGFDGFLKGYRHADPNVSMETVKEHFAYGDMDKNGRLDYNEFMALVESE